LAPSVMLTRPSSEVPMTSHQGHHGAARPIRPCPAVPSPPRPWRRR
jgi:hypothetical protein